MLKDDFAGVLHSLPKTNNLGEKITVVGATKMVAKDDIEEAVALGLESVGENRVQELCEKYPYPTPNLHFIGHLQTNKVKYIIDKVSLIQSCDSVKLAKTISDLARKHEKTQNVLLEVNVGKEPQKSGFMPDELFDAYAEITRLPAIRVKGLMTVLPAMQNFAAEPNGQSEQQYGRQSGFASCEEIAQLCLQMREIYDKLKLTDKNIDILSMGMSADYKIAIANGSNMLRIGSLLFGKRVYVKQ
ncbi:MAG: YggS family pyridoxal phosphate enzyme [Candidatus Borkfalkiaceae bacterium]|nr:YggS family pyridoxal phosphate enzyme [Christensenellaceae bacterium]